MATPTGGQLMNNSLTSHDRISLRWDRRHLRGDRGRSHAAISLTAEGFAQAQKEGKITVHFAHSTSVRLVTGFERNIHYSNRIVRGNSERIVQKCLPSIRQTLRSLTSVDGTVTAPMVKKAATWFFRLISPTIPLELKDPQGYWGVSNVTTSPWPQYAHGGLPTKCRNL
jgi:hypothetical protein